MGLVRLQTVLRNLAGEPHTRGCMQKGNTCSCGLDDRIKRALRQAANRIDDLETGSVKQQGG